MAAKWVNTSRAIHIILPLRRALRELLRVPQQYLLPLLEAIPSIPQVTSLQAFSNALKTLEQAAQLFQDGKSIIVSRYKDPAQASLGSDHTLP